MSVCEVSLLTLTRNDGSSLASFCSASAELFLVGLGLGLDRDLDDGRGKLDRFEHDRRGRIAERVAGVGIAQPDGADLAGVNFAELLALVRMHLEHAADAFALAAGRVEHRDPGLELARVHAQESQRAEVRVGHYLEGERGERRVVARPSLFDLVADLADHGRQVQRRRQVVDHRVEHRLHALVAKRGAEQHRRNRHLERGGADRGANRVGRGRLALEIKLHDVLVVIGERLDHLVAVSGGLLFQIGRDVRDAILRAETIFVPNERLLIDQIDQPGEFFLGANRQMQQQRRGLELVAHFLHHALELGADAIHLVDECDPRHAVLVGLAPDGLRLRLDAADRAEHRDRAVKHAQAALDLNREIDVPRRVDDIDAVVAPEAGGRRRRDRDAALLLLHHPVHRRGAFVHLADLVVDTGVEEHALCGGGLAGIDVGHDADIAHPFYWCLTSHLKKLGITSGSGRTPCWRPPFDACLRAS